MYIPTDEFASTCSSPPDCKNGGYLSVVDDACACQCPSGLDPNTNCETEIPAGKPISE